MPDLSEEVEKLIDNEMKRFKEKNGFWNPKTKDRRISYQAWLKKQAAQREKTLKLDGSKHSPQMKEVLKRQKLAYIEEYKRISDLIEDGK